MSKIGCVSLPGSSDTPAGRAGTITSRSRSRRTALRDWPEEELSRIWLVFRKLTALRIENPDDAEDIVQETFLTMTEKFPQIELQKGLLVWGMGILRRKVGNYYRRGNRAMTLNQEGLNLALAHLVQPQPAAELHIELAELRDLVHSLIRQLPPRERAVMDLIVEGLATNEIARLHYPEQYQNVANWIHRARRKLLKGLAKRGYMICAAREVRRGRKASRSSRLLVGQRSGTPDQ